MNIISKGQRVRVEKYALNFEWKDQPGAGFSFPCDKQDNLIHEQIASTARGNLNRCLSGEYAVVPIGVVDCSHTYWEPARGRCDCGTIVILNSSWTNSCERCGREYNGVGQLLAPRSQWGDEWVVQPEEDYGLY
jgi:hypothetical protein